MNSVRSLLFSVFAIAFLFQLWASALEAATNMTGFKGSPWLKYAAWGIACDAAGNSEVPRLLSLRWRCF